MAAAAPRCGGAAAATTLTPAAHTCTWWIERMLDLGLSPTAERLRIAPCWHDLLHPRSCIGLCYVALPTPTSLRRTVHSNGVL